MTEYFADAEIVSGNLAVVEDRVSAALRRVGRDPSGVTTCVATKYVTADGMDALRQAGVRVAAENRLQDMIVKQERFGADFEWHFIGRIQSRKIAEIAARVSTIHSLATESARDRLAQIRGPLPRILIQVNVSGESSKEGVHPESIGDFIASCPFEVHGLMTMPPLTPDPEAARPFFKHLGDLAAEHGLKELSMGTSQDFEVAVEEGATLIRVGSVLFHR
ncbi:MAG: YggS family pyridoxal phosphate-dependent enzyme [Actinobacteria bacterium]|nr:YggS family pyridoxal phosphate-dependent enzyme [Actinomycetota bacterium]